MKYIFLALSITFVFLFSSCVPKEDRCEQIAFSMMKQGVITMDRYQSQKIQKACVTYYDERGYDDWRSCMLSAEDSAKDMMKCQRPPYIIGAMLSQ